MATKETNPTTPTLKEFKITATIPTVQYGNIQPEYSIQAASFEEAETTALPYIEKLWARYCAKGSELKVTKVADVTPSTGEMVELTSVMTGEKAMFDKTAHTYFDADGNKMMGGSTFAKKFAKPFDKVNILQMMEDKHNIPKETIADLWKIKSESSMSFGTGIHAALELYGKYKDIGKLLGANKKPATNTALHDHPVIRKIVEEFYAGREKEEALYEEFVADSKRGICGQLDRVLIVDWDKKICRVQDFKTNADVNKKGFNGKLLTPFEKMADIPLNTYWIQLSFYADILIKAGWTVEALDVFAYDNKWTTYTHEPLDLSNLI